MGPQHSKGNKENGSELPLCTLVLGTKEVSFINVNREIFPFLPQIAETLDPKVVIVVIFIFTALNLPNKCKTASLQYLFILAVSMA